MHELGSPVVATSGNRTDEPMCTDEYEALQRLTAIADGFLVHNRPIARSMEDSVVRLIRDREVILRRARGYAPTPILTPPLAPPQRQEQVVPLSPAAKSCVKPSPIILAMGAQLKTTIAFYRDHQVFLSQHIGDLGSLLTMRALQAVIEDFQQFYDLSPTAIACDLHPDYGSTRLAQQWAHQKGIPLIPVQHHYAHVLACMVDNQLQSPVLGIAWDGTGYGFDHTLWGSEFLLITESSFQRLAHMRSFPLPGGEKAAREPRRSAMGLLFAGFGDAVFERQTWHPVQAFTPHDLRILSTLLKNQSHSPLTCSVGRLFDAIASLIGLRQTTQFEGQAAMDLEFCAEIGADDYRFEVLETQKLDAASPLILDWMPMVQSIVADLEAGVSIPKISAKFHKTLVEMILAIAKRVGVEQVVLTGGCFQNKLLTAAAISALRAAGFRPYCHRQVPPNDGGIALGQIMAALRHVTAGE
jgi:hydrogenase maturation protein HypF